MAWAWEWALCCAVLGWDGTGLRMEWIVLWQGNSRRRRGLSGGCGTLEPWRGCGVRRPRRASCVDFAILGLVGWEVGNHFDICVRKGLLLIS